MVPSVSWAGPAEVVFPSVPGSKMTCLPIVRTGWQSTPGVGERCADGSPHPRAETELDCVLTKN